MTQTLRFLHASDLHLERPLQGVSEIPPSLREQFLQAPYQAAERLFELAIGTPVDFVLLAGDVLNTRQASPRALHFLLTQFERLVERGIGVYWTDGKSESAGPWPHQLQLPHGVWRLPAAEGSSAVYVRDGVPTARIVNTGDDAPDDRMSDLSSHRSEDLPTFVVHYGKPIVTARRDESVRYWALGGSHAYRRVRLAHRGLACYPGTPQGRSPREPGQHGCVLGQLHNGHCSVQFMPTDVLRWRTEAIQVAGNASEEVLRQQIASRLAEIAAASDSPQLISWRIAADDPLGRRLRREGSAGQLLESLKREAIHGHVESVDLTIDPPQPTREQLDEDSVLGAFLRAVKQCEDQPERWLDLVGQIADSQPSRLLAQLARNIHQGQRREILHQVAGLGIDLLTGDKLGED